MNAAGAKPAGMHDRLRGRLCTRQKLGRLEMEHLAPWWSSPKRCPTNKPTMGCPILVEQTIESTITNLVQDPIVNR